MAFSNMTDDFDIVCSKIEEEKDFLNTVSQEIWRNPELKFEEVQAHAFLSNTFEKLGFMVERHYHLQTAFKAEYLSNKDPVQCTGPTVAILVEYDALPEIGHACGHNLIAEAGLAAAMAVKEVMMRDPTVPGKLVVMGTPAEEGGGGGKIRLIEKGAFEGIDAALMVHPTRIACASPPFLCNIRGYIEYKGREAHAAYSPWEGLNALDAAVMCYNNISVLRQQVRPDHRIQVIIKDGGVAINVIPARSRLEFALRAPTLAQMQKLRSRLEMCINGAATATGCEVNYKFDESVVYQNLISNRILINVYKKYFMKLGMTFEDESFKLNTASTDMGNVSHVIPAFHPVFPISAKSNNHTKEFAEASGLPSAQKSTLAAAKAMAMTALSVLRNQDLMDEAKAQFERDILEEWTYND